MAVDAPHGTPEPAPAARERKGLKKGLYLLPSAFTAANIGMGYYAVMAVMRGFQLLKPGAVDLLRATEQFDNASRAIGWAILFDALDGRIARLTKTTTEIGIQFDSIADVLTFGIAPAVLVYAWGYGSAFQAGSQLQRGILQTGWESQLDKLGWFLSFMFLICGAFRLARFNVQASRPRTLAEGTAKVDKKNFVGLPIPMAAGLLAAIVHFSPRPLVSFESSYLYSGLLMVLVASLGTLMVSTIRYSSFKTVGAGRRSTIKAMPVIAAAGMLLWLFSRFVLLGIVAAYVLQGPLFRLASLFQTRRTSEGQQPDGTRLS
ncbi:MAG TPA: phosphatidylcholine/phosphatidylserine synthase [Pyrinomonadaceae bacterium]|jgi:CDP-diacylglycerol--serine O-phosphatidyltransferase|nr:phosphatidylcholine/phosphatidylserine synthase [Pyrinomonadaceae bacterium]